MSRTRALALLTVALALLGAACTAGGDAGSGGDDAPVLPGGEPGSAPEPRASEPGFDLAAVVVPERIIREATVSLEVATDGFDAAYQRATLVASRYGGYLAGSSRSDGDPRTASVVLRVPSERFDAAMADVRDLGTVTAEESTTQDVTAEYVDLQARVRNWRAQEVVLLRLMDEAGTIEESITVQRRLETVQETIERLLGQLRVLRDRTDLSTITVELAEEGAAPPGRETVIGATWRRAAGGFVEVIGATVVAVGYLLPLLALAGGAWLVARAVRQRKEEPAATRP